MFSSLKLFSHHNYDFQNHRNGWRSIKNQWELSCLQQVKGHDLDFFLTSDSRFHSWQLRNSSHRSWSHKNQVLFSDWSSSFMKESFFISCTIHRSVLTSRSVCLRFDSLSPLAARKNRRHPSLRHAMTAPHACMKEIDFYIWPNPGGYFSVTDSIFSKRARRYIRTRRDRCDDL